MAKLFPPVIEGIIPAFYSENGIVKITIPFSLNRAVSETQIKAVSLKIKTVQSSSYLYTINSKMIELKNNPSVFFELNDENEKLKIGQFYKMQIAFIDDKNEIGYYSTVGVAKYTALPELTINNFTTGKVNSHTYQYTGLYTQNKDTTEKVETYRFDVYDNFDNVVYSSGDQLHNSSTDVEMNESYDVYNLNIDFPNELIYRIKYTVVTTNGLVISSPRYKIIQKSTLNSDLKAILKIENDIVNGRISIKLVGEKDTIATGTFLLSRSSSDSNFTSWDTLYKFNLMAQSPTRELFQDFTTEQGKTYQYSLQQYNSNGLYSNRILSDYVYSDFEDAFLYDGKRQLRIRYNPKVASFKVNTLEAKIDTIGGTYPFIFRNGRTYYKEFSISGLISYKSDESELFLEKNKYYFKEDTTNLTSDNICQEREFKMQVYEWLTNGKPKLFRSPGEGNFIVRLLNISLSPSDAVGRMLHSFTGTAYEIADLTYNNLSNYGIINLPENNTSYMQWKTVSIYSLNANKEAIISQKLLLNEIPVETIQFNDMTPGDKVEIVFDKGDSTTIVIGATGSYYINIGVPIKTITLLEGSSTKGSITYSYYGQQKNDFNKISNVTTEEIPARQFIGEHDIIKEIACVKDDEGKWVQNPKVQIIKFLYLDAQRRTQENLIEEIDNKGNLVYFKDKEKTYKLQIDEADPFTLFRIGHWKEPEISYSPSRPHLEFIVDKYYDIYNNINNYNSYEPIININNSIINIQETQNFKTSNLDDISTLSSGNGVFINCGYQIRVIDYSIEQNDFYNVGLSNKKKAYMDALEKFENFIFTDENYESYEDIKIDMKEKYRQYILSLVEAQKLEKEAEGGML